MNIANSPALVPLQVKDSLADLPSQPTPTGKKTAQGWSESVDSRDAPASSDVNTAGEHSAEGAKREKRGFKIPGFPKIFPKPLPKYPKVPSFGTAGTFTPTAQVTPRPAVGVPNSKGITNFREIVYKTQYPGAPVSGPSKPVVAQPKTFGDVAGNLIAADRLVKAGVFKTSPSLKIVARDAFINASVNGLVSTPLSVGTYAGSVWSGETIKGSFSAGTPLLPAAHLPAPSQLANGAVAAPSSAGPDDVTTTKLRLENSELKLLYAANTIQTLAEGGEAKALGKSPNWPTETGERLDNLEKLYDAAEKNLNAIAVENDFVFKPYKNDATPGSQSVTDRLDALDKRNEAINKGIARMVAIREFEEKDKE